MENIQKSEDSLQESASSLYHVVLKEEIQAVNIGNKSLYMFFVV